MNINLNNKYNAKEQNKICMHIYMYNKNLHHYKIDMLVVYLQQHHTFRLFFVEFQDHMVLYQVIDYT